MQEKDKTFFKVLSQNGILFQWNLSCALESCQNERNQNELDDNTRDGAEQGGADKGFKKICIAVQSRNEKMRDAVNDSARYHGNEQGYVIEGELFGEDTIQNTAHEPIKSKLCRHEKAFGNGGHGKDHGAKRRCHESYGKAPHGTADKTADQNGEMHGGEHSADLANLSG